MQRPWIATALLACGFGVSWLMPASLLARPNYLIILTDDLGNGDVSAYGASGVRTPNIDHLAAQGVPFDAMRVNLAAASPVLSGSASIVATAFWKLSEAARTAPWSPMPRRLKLRWTTSV